MLKFVNHRRSLTGMGMFGRSLERLRRRVGGSEDDAGGIVFAELVLEDLDVRRWKDLNILDVGMLRI